MDTNTLLVEDTRKIMDLIRIIVRSLRLSTKEYEQSCGLNGAQIFLMQQIPASGGISVNDLAERTYTHQSTVSQLLTRLTALGLVSRSRSKEDRRRQNIVLSSKGKKVLKDTPRTAQEELAAAIQELSFAKRRSLEKILKEVVMHAEWQQETPSLFFSESKKEPPRDRI